MYFFIFVLLQQSIPHAGMKSQYRTANVHKLLQKNLISSTIEKFTSKFWQSLYIQKLLKPAHKQKICPCRHKKSGDLGEPSLYFYFRQCLCPSLRQLPWKSFKPYRSSRTQDQYLSWLRPGHYGMEMIFLPSFLLLRVSSLFNANFGSDFNKYFWIVFCIIIEWHSPAEVLKIFNTGNIPSKDGV